MVLPRGRLNRALVYIMTIWLLPLVAQAELPLRLGIHPYLSPVELVEKFSPLQHYLQQQLRREVALDVSATSYQALADSLEKQQVDFAFMGPALYVSNRQQQPLIPLARLEIEGKPVFRGAIVTHARSGIEQLDQLPGKRFAFGSRKSTMSYLVPRYELEQSGVALDQLRAHHFLGSHRNVALAVLMEQFEAGAVKEAIYQRYAHRGLQLVSWTREIPEHLFVAAPHLSQREQGMLRKALLALEGETPQQQAVLQSIKPTVTALVTATESDYDELQALIQQVSR